MTVKTILKTWIHNHPKLYGIYKQNKLRVITSPFRVLPDFIIIGGQKCASTSLYDYIVQHPSIIAAKHKEIHYFDKFFEFGDNWYRSNFPLLYEKSKIMKSTGYFLTGEASPDYIIHPLAPKRMHELLPNVKIIIILRDPIYRAFSHYNMIKNVNREDLSFENAINSEKQRIDNEEEKIIKNEKYDDYVLRTYSYVYRGMYLQQIKKWQKYFHNEQFHILSMEDLQKNPQKSLNNIFKFLNLPNYTINNFPKKNIGKYREQINNETYKKLKQLYKPYNRDLFDYLGKKFDWDS